jgi:paraquat-inducible protein B
MGSEMPSPGPERATPPPPRERPPAPVGVRRRRSLSPIWLLPIVAALVGAWVAWSSYRERGPLVEIAFDSAEGLVAGQTKVRFKDIEVGVVDSLRISDDLQEIIATARMESTAADYLNENTRFWIVRPRVGTSGVSGLGTLLSGVYIELDTSLGGERQWRFEGIEDPPLIRSTVPGRTFVLQAADLGWVSRGAPVYHRGVQVGQVLGYELVPEAEEVEIYVFVRSPHDDLVQSHTRFWNVSGVQVSAGAGGVNVNVAPLGGLLFGGIAFDTPEELGPAVAIEEGQSFPLYASEEAQHSPPQTDGTPFIAYFDGSVRGLNPGAPVEFRGIRVGTVNALRLEFDREANELHIPVLFDIEPWRFADQVESDQDQDLVAAVERLVERGLRARLETGNLLTGELLVALDFYEDVEPASLGEARGYPQIPAVPGQLEALTASLGDMLEQFATLPLEETVTDLRAALNALEELAGGSETRASLAALQGSLTRFERVMTAVEQDLPPTLESLRETSTAAARTLESASSTLASTNELLGGDSRLRRDLANALQEFSRAARSIREFADYLERNPDALIRGRRSSR